MIDRPRKSCSLVTSLLALALAGVVSAEDSGVPPGDPDRIGFLELAELAQRHYPELEVVAAERAGADSLRSLAYWTRWSPKVKSSALFGVVPDAQGTIFDSPDSPRDLNDLGPFVRLKLEVSQPLFTFGRLRDAQAAAQLLYESTAMKAEVKRRTALDLASRAYFGWLYADGSVDLIDDVRAKVDKLLDKLESPGEDDPDPEPLDILRARNYALQLERLRAGAVRDRVIAADALRLLANRPTERPLRPRPAKLEALAEPAIEVAPAIERGLARLPELRALELASQAKEKWAAIHAKESLPVLGLEGRVEYGSAPGRQSQDNPFVYEPFNVRSVAAVLALQWNLNFKHNQAQAAKVRSEAHELRAQHGAVAVKARHDVASAHARLEAARSVHDTTRRSLSVAANWFRVADENYSLETASLKDVIDAYSNLIQTRSAHLEALYSLDLAVIAWRVILGEPLAAEGETP